MTFAFESGVSLEAVSLPNKIEERLAYTYPPQTLLLSGIDWVCLFVCLLSPTGSKLNIAMNKGGVGGAPSGAGGPTAAAAAAAAQKQKSLQKRVDDDIGSIVDNFSIVVNVARVNDPPVRNSQEAFMMEVRAAKMVQAADSLLKLVSELKQTAIFSGFASLNDHVDKRTTELNQQAEKTDRMLARIGEDAAASLKEMESHYYSSILRSNQPSQQ